MDPAEHDKRHVWHPFTQMREWNAGAPLVIVEAEGAVLRDAQGRECRWRWDFAGQDQGT